LESLLLILLQSKMVESSTNIGLETKTETGNPQRERATIFRRVELLPPLYSFTKLFDPSHMPTILPSHLSL
jgi:hypothetical protein